MFDDPRKSFRWACFIATVVATSLGCFKHPTSKVAQMVCFEDVQCPIGFECKTPGTPGGCKRNINGTDSGLLGKGGAVFELRDAVSPDLLPAQGGSEDTLDARPGTGGNSGLGGTSGIIDVGDGAGLGLAQIDAAESSGTRGTGGISGMGGTSKVCQEGASQCTGNNVQTCSNGRWGFAIACGPRQTCGGPIGTAKCTCNIDSVCKTVGGTCETKAKLTTCAQDAQGCFYVIETTTCMNGACTAGTDGSSACCTNACTVGVAECTSTKALQTCSIASNGCTATSTSSCAPGQVCQGGACKPQSKFKQITTGYYHACGLKSDGSVACWGSGRNEDGQLPPVPEGSYSQIVADDAYHTCGLKTDGSVACWGTNQIAYLQPLPAFPEGTYSHIATGLSHMCGVRVDSSIVCYGSNYYGETSPVPEGPFSRVTAGLYHSCGLRPDGSVTCWGLNASEEVPPGTYSQVSAGGSYTCGLKMDGSVLCWGSNYKNVSSPTPNGPFSQISTGQYHACGRRKDGSVACWGWDYSNSVSAIPVASFTQVSAGYYFTCGLRVDGTVTCWGSNSFGGAPSEVP